MIGNCTLESLSDSSTATLSCGAKTGQTAIRCHAHSPSPRIASFQIGDEAGDLHHALFMEPRKPPLKAFFNATKSGWPKDHPSEDQEWRSDRARQQQAADPANNQKDAELFGYALIGRVHPAIVRGLTRAS
jgi:hypothetical protein